MASLRTRVAKSGETTYAVLFRHGGKQSSETFMDAKHAEVFKAEVEAFGPDRARKRLEVRLVEEGRRRNLTVDELFVKWLEAMDLGRIVGELTQETVRRYQLNYETNIRDVLGHRDCGLVDPDDIQDVVDAWVREGFAPNTISGRYAKLKKMFDWATQHRQQILVTSPCNQITLPKVRRIDPKGLRAPEVVQFLDAARRLDLDLYDVLAFLVSTGWRKSEMMALTAESVEDTGDDVFVTMSQVERRGEGIIDAAKTPASHNRRLRVVGPGVEVLRRRVADLSPGDLVFTHPDSRGRFRGSSTSTPKQLQWKATALKERWDRLLEVADLPGGRNPTPHWIRHSHVAICLAAGMDMYEISRRVGHASIKTTVDTYGKMADGMTEEVAARINALLDSAAPALRVVDGDGG